jgi:putative transposase
MKNVVLLYNYHYHWELEWVIADFDEYYNNQRYHESLENMTPANIYYGKDKEVKNKQEKIMRRTMT